MSTFIRLSLPMTARFAVALLACACALGAFAAPPLLKPHRPAPGAMEVGRPRTVTQPFAVEVNREGLAALKPGDEVDLELPNGNRHEVVFDLSQDHGGSISSWIGYLKDTPDRKRVIITSGPGGSFGVFSTPRGDFRLVPGGNHDWLVDMAAEQPHLPGIDLTDDDVALPPQPPTKAWTLSLPAYATPVPGVNVPLTAKAGQPNAIVDLMVVYTSGFGARFYNPLTRILNLVTAANTAYSDSNVHITLRLVHTVEVDYPDVGNGFETQEALYAISPVDPDGSGPRLPGGAGVFANIESQRATHGADLVVFLRNGLDYAGDGAAWVPSGPITLANAASLAPGMYSVVTGCVYGCNFLFAHQLGHNMGNLHDRATVAWQSGGRSMLSPGLPQGSTSYSYGYAYCSSGALSCDPTRTPAAGGCRQQPECSTGAAPPAGFAGAGTNNFRDIMAFFQYSTAESGRFSNPDIACIGNLGPYRPCGVYAGNADGANAAQSMNQNAAGLSAIRSTGIPPSVTVQVVTQKNPSFYGEVVTFMANLTATSGPATGSVRFNIPGHPDLCTAVFLQDQKAYCYASLPPGSYSVTADFLGDLLYPPASTTTPWVQNVGYGTPYVYLSSNLPPLAGEPVSLAASIGGFGITPTGTVAFSKGGVVLPGCSAAPLKDGIARCGPVSLPGGTHVLSASYSGAAPYYPASGSSTLYVDAQVATNYALAANGGQALASSTAGPSNPLSAVIDGDKVGAPWWEDATHDTYPDWVEIRFPGMKKLSQLVVYTLANAYSVEPDDNASASTYGVKRLQLEYWANGTWLLLADETSDRARRAFNLYNVETDRVRVRILSAGYYKSRIVEIEAWGTPSSTPVLTNFALASNYAAASASSTHHDGMDVASAIDDDVTGATWGDNGGWEDGTHDAYPDYVEVAFNGYKRLRSVVVYTLRDDVGATTEPDDYMLTTRYGLRDYTVEYWTGSGWNVLGTAVNNFYVKRIFTTDVTTTKIRVNVTAARYYKSRIVEIQAWGTAESTEFNHALAAAGSTATASSDYGAPFSLLAATIDNNLSSTSWGNGGGWASMGSTFPNWLEINFNQARDINRVVVVTLRDNYSNPSLPSDTETFTLYGLVNYRIEGWNGAGWDVLGTATANNLVRRTFQFPTYNTSRIRVWVDSALNYQSRVVEVQAWGT